MLHKTSKNNTETIKQFCIFKIFEAANFDKISKFKSFTHKTDTQFQFK